MSYNVDGMIKNLIAFKLFHCINRILQWKILIHSLIHSSNDFYLKRPFGDACSRLVAFRFAHE
jgi:hypothetical protein